MTNQRINDVDTITTISGTDRILVNTDVVNNVLEQIEKDDFVADIVSTDTNNLIEIGTDNKLFSELPSEAIFGDTIYGGTIVTDLNTINKNGFYTCYGTATGVPSSSYSWFVIHQNSNAGTASATQRAVAYNSTPIIYERVKTSSTWGAWTLQGSGSGGGVVEFDNKGTVTTNITLAENKITTGHWSGTNTITLPTVTDTTKQVVCILDFTTATSGQPTITNTNLKWSDKNGGKAPTAYSIVSGVRNLLVFKSIWISSALYWEVEYTICGGVETTFVQPTLSANGTLGGSSFAVAASSEYSGREAYKGVDGNPSTRFGANNILPSHYIWYNPNALKVTNIAITNPADAGNYISGYTLYGSNDNLVYTIIASGTNTVSTANTLWNLSANSNNTFYKYHKLYWTGNDTYVGFAQATLGATYIAT